MKNLLKISVALFVAVSLGACGNGKNEEPKNTVTVQGQMDSEELALAGEQLVNPATFMLADKTFSMALEKDPENKRAQFYKMFLKQFMVLKGAGSRIRPWVRANGEIVDFETGYQKFPNSPLKDFIYKGKEDISTTADLQTLLVEYRNAILDYYGWLKKNQDLELTLNLNPFVFQHELRGEELNSCVVVSSNSNEFKVECDYTEIAQRKVNAADMIAIRQMVAGQVLYFTIYTAYSMDGIEKINKANRNGNMTQGQVQALLFSNSNFGKLRKDNTLSIISSLGADLLSAWKWAMANQATLCPYGDTSEPGFTREGNYIPDLQKKNRKGHLVDNGLCTKTGSQAEQDARIFEQALGGAITISVTPPGTQVAKNVVVDPLATIRRPVVDLRDIAPMAYNSCGKAVKLKDKTLGGTYPQGNAEDLLDKSCGI